MSGVLISSLDFTEFVGRYNSPEDMPFSDVIDIGGFPFEQNIQGIKHIKVFSDKLEGEDDAVIVGLEIEYNLPDSSTTAYHGRVGESESMVGDFTISTHQLLVGVHGRLKNLPTNLGKHDRIASISFVLINQDDATLETKGPYGTDIGLSKSWGTFGQIIGFQGRRTDDLGLTSLGFAKCRSTLNLMVEDLRNMMLL